MQYRHLLLGCCLATALIGCGKSADDAAPEEEAASVATVQCPAPNEAGIIEIAPGLEATITSKGYGRVAVAGDYADVHTTLWLYDENAEGGRGTEIWTSGGVNPFQFQLGAGQVIQGWDLGVICMSLGETRELKIPPELAYGARGKPPVPPNATLLFEIELVNLLGQAESRP
jgi:FKBP-type peptidyl-prolyl cis-trans isomerase